MVAMAYFLYYSMGLNPRSQSYIHRFSEQFDLFGWYEHRGVYERIIHTTAEFVHPAPFASRAVERAPYFVCCSTKGTRQLRVSHDPEISQVG